MSGRIRAVWFDVGETLVDEQEPFGRWADWMGVPRHTLSAAIGAGLARGDGLLTIFRYFRPDFDLTAERRARAAAGVPDLLSADDLYPDARPCLAELRARGFFVGVAGNQPASAEGPLRAMDLPADVVATSAGWGVQKPDPAFFARILAATGLEPAQIAYVGDRVDNDVLPARAAGMLAVRIRRGMWSYLDDGTPAAASAGLTIDRLTDLADLLP